MQGYNMKTYRLTLTTIAASISLTACVKEPLYDTDHPEHGKITLSTVWDERGEGIDIPGEYTLRIKHAASEYTYMVTLSGIVNTPDELFPAGSHRIHIYNAADNITISSTTASADYSQTLGWLFTGTENVNIKKDKDHHITVAMHQQVRQLTLVIDPEGETASNIENITASLSGVAGTLDMDNDVHGTPSSISLTFVKGTNNKWSATVRLLGITGSEQKLSGTITFTGGSPGDIALGSDLTAALTNFNADKKNPLMLGGKIIETPSGVGFGGAIINAWQEQGTINGEAGYQ